MKLMNTHISNSRIESIKNMPANEVFFYFTYGAWLILLTLYSSYYSVYLTAVYAPVRYLLLGILLVGEIANTMQDRKSLPPLIAISLMAFLALNINGSALFDALVFVYCARNIPFEKIARFSLAIILVVFVFILLSMLCGILPDLIGRYKGGTRLRHFLGFRYALFPSQIVFNLTCLSLFINRNDLRLKHILLLLVVNGVFFYLTDSRLSFFLAAGLTIACYGMSRRPYSNFIGRFAAICFIVSTVLGIAFTVSYNPANSWMSELNSFLNNRLYYANAALREYGFTIFGTPIDFIGASVKPNGTQSTLLGKYFYVDCLYVKLGIQYGILFLALFLVLMTLASRKAAISKDNVLCLIMVAIALHCLIDDLSIQLYYNTFLFLIGSHALTGEIVRKAKKG